MKRATIFDIALVLAWLLFPISHALAIWPASKVHSPETYFDGQALEVARAIQMEDLTPVRSKIRAMDLNSVTRQGMTLLFYASVEGKFGTVAELIRAGANPNQIDKELGSPLDLAVQAKKSDLLAAMLDGGVSPNALNSWGTPLLFTAATLNSPENLRLLVLRGADLNIRDKFLKRVALHEAISQKFYDNAIYLVEQGADVNVATVNGLTLAYSVQWDLEHHRPNSLGFEKLSRLKRMMEDRGIKFPATPPPAKNQTANN